MKYIPESSKSSQNYSIIHSLPWLLGWISLTVMGPLLAAQVLYKTCYSVMSCLLNLEKTLCGKVVLITGASSGLGKALAHVLYQKGCKLILASRNLAALEDIKQDLINTYKPPELHVPKLIRLDLEDLTEIPNVMNKLLKSVGHMDVLINNAGMSSRGDILSTDVSVYIKMMVVNYFGHIAVTKSVLPHMLQKQGGHIIGISSIQGKLAQPYRSNYAASKHAFQAFMDSLRAEVSSANILVSIVNPGYINTNLSMNALSSTGDKYGVTDITTQNGMDPMFVAKEIVQRCLILHEEEISLYPWYHRLAVYMRNISPSLLFTIMKFRAKLKKHSQSVNKEN